MTKIGEFFMSYIYEPDMSKFNPSLKNKENKNPNGSNKQ
jgi:hypothetical protein